MDLIHFVVKDGVLNSVEPSLPSIERDDLDSTKGTVYECMKYLQHQLELSRVTMGKLRTMEIKFLFNG